MDFCWMLDTRHGAEYFHRWHRMRGNSGSLLVHKATHHFDLVNWWIDDIPEEVFAHGSLRYYTGATAEHHYVNWIEIDYLDTFTAESSRLLFNSDESGTLQAYMVRGWS